MTPLNKAAVRFIVVHCSATPPDADIGADEIRRWHVEDNGWSDIGYHYVIRRAGVIEHGRSLDYQGAHVRGYNHESVGICLVGGVSKDGQPDANFTAAQYGSLESLISLLLPRFPGAAVRGHRDFPGVTKACPSFDAAAWWSQRNENA
jgi:N-acetyl-anhydromuramyl-L-alanine amidase AmpD